MPRLLFLSNGHGEDSIAGRLIDALREAAPTDLSIEGWPMVGSGSAYRERDVIVCGSPNLLPSEGFATLSLSLLARDLRAGWVGTHLRQVRAARALSGRFDLAVAVGDVVVMLAAALARTPYAFVGCAKSDYYGPGYGYTRFELGQLRRRCLMAFPRDARTAQTLIAAGVPTRYVGNPMMDGLLVTGALKHVPDSATVIGCLPGSRADAVDNALWMLRMLVEVQRAAPGEPLHGLIAVAAGFALDHFKDDVGRTLGSDWRIEAPLAGGTPLRLSHRAGLQVDLVDRCFADVLDRATLVLGTAGTANEQAVGLGKPVVAFATEGTQGRAYLAMKMRYFGDAALEVPRDPVRAAPMIRALLASPERRARMAAAGRERMGAPGATATIATAILTALDARRGAPGAPATFALTGVA